MSAQCRRAVGSNPGWMNSDLYDAVACKCVLEAGHAGRHQCADHDGAEPFVAAEAMSADPTAEHIDAEPAGYPPVSAEHIDAVARVIYPAVTSTDPAVHAALAAALPAEVMLAALVDRGALHRTEGTMDLFGYRLITDNRRDEVAP